MSFIDEVKQSKAFKLIASYLGICFIIIQVLDPLAEMYVIGSSVDYITEMGGSFLTLKNPQSTSMCGCGESFGI